MKTIVRIETSPCLVNFDILEAETNKILMDIQDDGGVIQKITYLPGANHSYTKIVVQYSLQVE